jgi:hypothetical protein
MPNAKQWPIFTEEIVKAYFELIPAAQRYGITSLESARQSRQLVVARR